MNDRAECMIHMYKVEKLSLQQIGDFYGITRERVRQILDRAGIKRREQGRSSTWKPALCACGCGKMTKFKGAKLAHQGRFSSAGDEKRMVELYTAGLTTYEIAAMYETHHQIIGYHLNKQGVKMRKRGRRVKDGN